MSTPCQHLVTPSQHHLNTISTPQGVQLEALGGYFDTDTTLLGPTTDWPNLIPSQWEYLFNPQQMSEQHPEAFVLRPIDGGAMYLRRGRRARQQPEIEAVHDAEVSLEDITLHVSRMWGCVWEGDCVCHVCGVVGGMMVVVGYTTIYVGVCVFV